MTVGQLLVVGIVVVVVVGVVVVVRAWREER